MRKNEPTEQYRAMLELRRSSAAQPHADRRTRKQRTRADARRAAIRRSADD